MLDKPTANRSKRYHRLRNKFRVKRLIYRWFSHYVVMGFPVIRKITI